MLILGRRQVIILPWRSVHYRALSTPCYTTDGSANDILVIKWTTYNHILTTPEYVPPALTLIAVLE